MRRRFVIGVEALDSAQEQKFRDYLERHGEWWHWIGHMWLFTTNNEKPTVTEVRGFLEKLRPNARVVVMEFPEDLDWATSGTKNAEGSTISEWLEGVWKRER